MTQWTLRLPRTCIYKDYVGFIIRPEVEVNSTWIPITEARRVELLSEGDLKYSLYGVQGWDIEKYEHIDDYDCAREAEHQIREMVGAELLKRLVEEPIPER